MQMVILLKNCTLKHLKTNASKSKRIAVITLICIGDFFGIIWLLRLLVYMVYKEQTNVSTFNINWESVSSLKGDATVLLG